MTDVKYFDVSLVWKSRRDKASPFVSARIECMPAKDKDDAKERALKFFALAGSMMQVTDVKEL